MKNKTGLIFSHLHVRENEDYKFDILSHNIEHFRNFSRDFFVVVSGHGKLIPKSIIDKTDAIYWENTIDHNEIGRGHPKFCKKAYKIMISNNIEKTIKLRAADIIKNEEVFYKLLDSKNLVITEQTSFRKRMLGDLLMFGETRISSELWSVLPWDYDKSGLYNLHDNMERLAITNNVTTREYYQKQCFFVSPREIGWYTLENNWDHDNKEPKEELGDKHLWGALPGYKYYGGF